MRLLKQDSGPVSVEVDDEWEHELDLAGVDEEPGGLHGRARDRAADDVLYRFVTPDGEETPVYLERRHARDAAETKPGEVKPEAGDWERLGEVTDVAVETNIG
ncbi:hypothetical protein GCM10009039_28820 [Halocalculus aciditolerans]|uniref:Uncharacterized protein n=2 Tax=Halocalculus aciditolerans TaxID=1383812 RepID=A0A830FA05_9EURY|nr:hypothetical protein GCM10009039_28820 [Halocalculus aciditolerans]